jgi:hypothetical protein
MSRNTIALVDLNTEAPELRTSYDPKGQTGDRRYPNGQIAWSSCVPVGGARRKWRATPGMARDLALLDQDVRARGGEGIRLTETDRDVTTIVEARTRYVNWVAAGRPDPSSSDGRFVPKAMKTAYVAPPNGTNHQWAGATDFNVFALSFPGAKGDEVLGIFWELAAARGFTPIIAEPRLMQSEAWHFDHLGPLAGVKALFKAHRDEGPQYHDYANHVAAVGCILAGTYAGAGGDTAFIRLAQALMLLDGMWCGVPDGEIGPKTIGALLKCGIQWQRGMSGGQILGALGDRNIGLERLADL